MMESKKHWTNCKTYGVRFFNLEDESYPKLCDDKTCNHCFASKEANRIEGERIMNWMFNNNSQS